MSEEQDASGHSRRPLDNGEYVCECGWVPDWRGDSLEEQIAAHQERDL